MNLEIRKQGTTKEALLISRSGVIRMEAGGAMAKGAARLSVEHSADFSGQLGPVERFADELDVGILVALFSK